MRQPINLGSPTPGPGMPGADTRFEAFRKADEMFAELYGPLGLYSFTIDTTLGLQHASAVVECDAATAGLTVTIPANADVAFPVNTIIELVQVNTWQITVAGAAGVLLRNADSSFVTRRLWSSITLRQRALNEWVVSGDTA